MRKLAVPLIGILFGASTGVWAQQVAASFDQLRTLANAGDTVMVTDTVGRKVSGTITDLSSSSLGVAVGGIRHSFAEADVTVITQERHADLCGGAKLGFTMGAIIGMVPGLLGLSDSGSNFGPGAKLANVLGPAAVIGSIGAAAGAGISYGIHTQHVIYLQPASGAASVKLTVRPFLHRERTGVSVLLVF